FGLTVFGIVEQVLWPVRAHDALRARLAEVLRLLAGLARHRATRETLTGTIVEVDAWRRRVSPEIGEVQGLVESSKFEPGVTDLEDLQARTGAAQVVFVLLLTLARHAPATNLPRLVQAEALEVDTAIATVLEALATHAVGDFKPVVMSPVAALDAL